MIIGITGGTGCGKTTALQVFGELGGTVLDCDAIYHRLLVTDKVLLTTIESRFPGVVQDGVLDRKKLGTIVFADPDALSDLNAITHTAVKNEVLHQVKAADGHVAIDAIALFESGLAELCDETVAVTAPEECRTRRLMLREGISEAYARARIAAQKPQTELCAMCGHRLENDGTPEQFRQKCLAFFNGLGII